MSKDNIDSKKRVIIYSSTYINTKSINLIREKKKKRLLYFYFSEASEKKFLQIWSKQI